MNNYATRAAYDAQEEVAAGVRYLKKFDSAAVRKALTADYARPDRCAAGAVRPAHRAKPEDH